MNNLVLVGFGKQKLIELIEKIGDPEEEEKLLNIALGGGVPPVYREEPKCSQEEKLAMIEFTGWLTSLLQKYNEEEK